MSIIGNLTVFEDNTLIVAANFNSNFDAIKTAHNEFESREGAVRYNVDLALMQRWNGTIWINLTE